MEFKYLDAEFWVEYLNPLEIAYLMMYAQAFEKRNDLIGDAKLISSQTELDEEYDNGEYEYEFINEEYVVQLKFDYSIHTTEGHSGTYYDPPEGGEAFLDSLTVTSIYVWAGNEETDIDTSRVFDKCKSNGWDPTITYKDFHDLCEICAINTSELDMTTSLLPDYRKMVATAKIFPQKLIDKIEAINVEHHKRIRNKRLNKKYGL
jgi:hypothetical protein